jgi:hypothetical protein
VPAYDGPSLVQADELALYMPLSDVVPCIRTNTKSLSDRLFSSTVPSPLKPTLSLVATLTGQKGWYSSFG